ncbi:glycine zipper 2TM domain-containing protein [Cupriavidus basilensis]|uniref:Glycine zipper 2TM domain-containing protein n=1 Tax=Cupriavidus basilensis TaxID=68895 RepID=A0ABT6AXG9_9BURK|nr:glycine zipper 2TM domain-containing protein [Cupriavidus basilensis]MDF3837314.1 glycine zipper 2TM domain-containing protein [Cupriavidus basilensis]
MNGKTLLGVAAAAAVVGMAGCAAPGGGYGNGYGGGYGGGYGAPPPQTGYQQPPQAGYQAPGANTYQAPPNSVFYGKVESIEPVTTQQSSSGLLGTVIGGVAGGLLGHQIGGGRGNTVATIGGAVAGGLAGNQIEKHASSGTDTVYRVNVRLDDGRMATVTQRDVSRLRIGARAQVAGDMATPY